MLEKLLYMQEEDGLVAFEKKNGDVIYCKKNDVPSNYKYGDIILCDVKTSGDKVVIDFSNSQIDLEEMRKKRERIEAKRRILWQ